MTERVAIIEGIRTPFCKAGGVFKDIDADDLGAYAVKELIARTGIHPEKIDQLIFGNVMQTPKTANIARVIAVKAGLPVRIPAHTVNRNCASGMEAISEAAEMIQLGKADVIIAGGTESMSNYPILFRRSMRDFLQNLSKAKSFKQKFFALFSFRPSMLAPEIVEIGDPLCGLNMGQTAEILSRELHVTRAEQDAFALASQQRAGKAIADGRFAEEIVPVPIPPKYQSFQKVDDGVRQNTNLESLAKLNPAFDRVTGTVTAGNASQVTDGASAVLLMSESKAKELGFKPIGYIVDFAYAGLDPSRMGLGPVYATSKVLDKTGLKLSDFDLIEINEAFAAQVLASLKAFSSDEFAKKYLGKDRALGTINQEKLNVNGGAISLGHPLGASGARLVLTLLKELKKRNKKLGLATLCVGGGQGGAIVVEAAS